MPADSSDDVDAIMAAWAREMPDADLSRFEAHLRLARTASLFGRLVEQVLSESGLDLGQWSVITCLRRNGPPYSLTSTELARSTLCTASAMTKRVDRLERAGLVARSPDVTDRRAVVVRLMPKGIQLASATAVQTIALVHDVMRIFSDTERDALTLLLRRLQAGLDAGLEIRSIGPATPEAAG